MKYSMPLWINYYKLKEFLPLFALNKIVANYYGLHCHFYCLLTKKYFLLNLAGVLRSSISKKSGAPIFIYNLISIVGHYNESTVVRNHLFINYISKINESINYYLYVMN